MKSYLCRATFLVATWTACVPALQSEKRGRALHDGCDEKSGGLPKHLKKLQKEYLQTVRMGLLGGLTHAAFTDPDRGGSTDPAVRGQCMTRDWESGTDIDVCITKWDGNERLKRVENLYNLIQENGIEGDLVECGVWRGGITIFMKALLRANGDEESRKVWVADSFNGVPNVQRQREDRARHALKGASKWAVNADEEQWGGHVTELTPHGKYAEKNILTVEYNLVKDNFERFGLLDNGVQFLAGWFNETLPHAPKKGLRKISLLRVDGDLYSSTMDVLQNLYPLVTPGGWIILDDWPLPQSREATLNFFKDQGLDPAILRTDRITPESMPTKKKDPPSFSEINRYAYFQKPLAAKKPLAARPVIIKPPPFAPCDAEHIC